MIGGDWKLRRSDGDDDRWSTSANGFSRRSESVRIDDSTDYFVGCTTMTMSNCCYVSDSEEIMQCYCCCCCCLLLCLLDRAMNSKRPHVFAFYCYLLYINLNSNNHIFGYNLNRFYLQRNVCI